MIIKDVKEDRSGKKVLTDMIVSSEVLAHIAARWDGSLSFDKPDFDRIASWCIKHHNKYGKAPGPDIENYFAAWSSRNGVSEGVINATEKILADLNEDYERLREAVNVKFAIDRASNYFRETRLRKLFREGPSLLDLGHLDKAEDLVTSHIKTELQDDDGVHLFDDPKAISEAFADKSGEVLVSYEGALGQLTYGFFERDAFVTFMAEQKTGKSFFLMDLAYRLLLKRRRVAYFQVGDLSEAQIRKRFLARCARHPYRSPDGKWPYIVNYPLGVKVERDADGNYQAKVTDWEERKFRHPLDDATAKKAAAHFLANFVKSKESRFRLIWRPILGISIEGIEAKMRKWQRQDWYPDAVIIDYMDNLAPPQERFKEPRDQINQTWAKSKKISDDYKCLIVSATQVNARAYEQRVLDKRNFSGDNRKYNHVTAMIGLKSSGKDKEGSIIKANVIALREGGFSASRHVYIAHCLPIADPAVCSTF